jgi:cyclic lactone autoinducer peptide
MRLKGKQKLMYNLLGLLLMMAPIISSYQASMYLWGEPDIPDSLRN